MRRMVRRIAGFVGLAVIGSISYLGYLHASGNFHEVSAGQVYRAAQMDGEQLARWHDRYGIKSVLNLRGPNAGHDWYDAEVATANRLGIAHIDFGMSASHALNIPEAQRLIEVMRTAPKPLLIHCAGGADRTGLAAALYVAGIEHRSETAAEWQLSPRYGHVVIPGVSAAWPMDVTWERIESDLGFDS